MRTLALGLVGLVVVAAGLFFAFSGSGRVPPIDTSGEDLGQAIEAWLDDRHAQPEVAFNGAILVINDGEVIIRKAWGKDGEGRALTPTSKFRLASVSKAFTASAILKLAQDERLALDSPVADQIEGCTVNATPAQLLRHISGIPDDYLDKADPEQLTTVPMVFDQVCEGSRNYEAPGEFSYNNTGYVFLAGLVERVSEQSFESYLAREVLAPLELESTRVWNLVSGDDFADRAITFDAQGKLVPTNVDGVAGDGAVFSTLDDLANWARFWRDDRLLSAPLKDRATGLGGEDAYHFGWNRSGDRVEHTGGWLGARTYLGFEDTAPDGDVVIFLDNGSTTKAGDIVREIWSALGKD